MLENSKRFGAVVPRNILKLKPGATALFKVLWYSASPFTMFYLFLCLRNGEAKYQQSVTAKW